MKKTLTAALALLLALLLTACSLNISNLFNTSKDDPAPPPVEEPAPPAPPAEPTEPALPSQSEEPSIPEEEQPSPPGAPQPAPPLLCILRVSFVRAWQTSGSLALLYTYLHCIKALAIHPVGFGLGNKGIRIYALYDTEHRH